MKGHAGNKKLANGLTPSQAEFLAEYSKTFNGAEAMRRLRPDWTDKQRTNAVTRIMREPGVEAMLMQFAARAQVTAECNYDQHMAKLAELRDSAMGDGEWSSAIRAEELRGKCAGLYIERRETDKRVTVEIVRYGNGESRDYAIIEAETPAQLAPPQVSDAGVGLPGEGGAARGTDLASAQR